MRRTLYFLLGLWMFTPQAGALPCGTTYNCDQCARWCNTCVYDWYAEGPFAVHRLPIEFTYVRSDTNTSNDVGPFGCGAGNCNSGETRYMNNRLPIQSNNICWVSSGDPRLLPNQMSCRRHDGRAVGYCDEVIGQTCVDNSECPASYQVGWSFNGGPVGAWVTSSTPYCYHGSNCDCGMGNWCGAYPSGQSGAYYYAGCGVPPITLTCIVQ